MVIMQNYVIWVLIDIANDVEKRSDTSNYEVNRPLPTGKNKKVI